MSTNIYFLMTFIVLLHFCIWVWAWIEKRLKPYQSNFLLFQNETKTIWEIKELYEHYGLTMISNFDVDSTPILQAEMKRLETRVFIELIGVMVIGSLPPMAILFS